MEIKSKFLCSKGVALAFAMLLGGSPGVLLYANDSDSFSSAIFPPDYEL